MLSPSPTDHLPTAASELMALIAAQRATIGVVGLGYVGLPLALTAARTGFPVLGFDINEPRTWALNRGESVIGHVPAEAIAEARAHGRFEATADFSRLREADAILICVPTPLTKQREPDLSYVVDTARAIAAHLRKGQLIVLESTTYPGTTAEVVQPILEETGLRSGMDVFLAYSPEREDPGNAEFGTARIPKVVGSDDPAALALSEALYRQLVVTTVAVSSAAAAEAVKLTENIFRAVNIALVNELKVVYEAMGLDVWEIIEAAKTKPFGYMPFYPGPGLGGHCIPIDPFYLAWKAREYDVVPRFVELAGEINTRMPYHVVDRLVEVVNQRAGRSFAGARILILGVTYKKNVDDIRESPALKLIELIETRGALADYHDPFRPELPPTREHAALAGRRSVPLVPATISDYDAVLIATDHDGVDYGLAARHARVVVDTRNACQRAGIVSDNVVKA